MSRSSNSPRYFAPATSERGHALGLDLAMLRDVFSQTGANSRVLVTDGEDLEGDPVNIAEACAKEGTDKRASSEKVPSGPKNAIERQACAGVAMRAG